MEMHIISGCILIFQAVGWELISFVRYHSEHVACLEFIAGNTSEIAQWAWSDDGEYVVLSMWLATQQKFAEVANHAQDATEYYAIKKVRIYAYSVASGR